MTNETPEKTCSDYPSAEFRFFIYDHCNGDFTYYRTPEERDAASDAVIQQYLDDGWDEDVELVVAGEVTAVATKVNVIERPPEDQIDDEGMDEDGRYWGEEHAYCCNYELLPIIQAPEQQAAPVSVPEVWKLVPVEPTPRMIDLVENIARLGGIWSARSCYEAMIEVAPTPPAQQPDAQATLDRICDLFRIGRDARTPAAIMTNVENVKRFADQLRAVEVKFFTVPGKPDEDEPEEEPQPECLLNSFGSTPEQYVEQFRAALAAIAPPAQQSQWVPVSERLPSEDQGTVAVLFDDGHPGVAWATYWHGARTDFAQWTFPLDDLGDGREVTHWMPLPAAPGDTAPPAPEQSEQDAMKVPRALLERIEIACSQGDLPTLREAMDELRALLGGGEA